MGSELTSPPRAARADAGFTLLEVLMAVTILAIGLLALEAMGIGAARSVRRGEVQTGYTATAQDLMEKTLTRITLAPTAAIADTSYTGTGGERVWRTASAAGLAGTTRNGVAGTTLNLWTVNVRVLPPTSLGVLQASDSVNITSNVIR